MKRYLLLPLIFVMLLGSLAAQNVGIGVPTPVYKLDISGTLHSTGNAYFDNSVGIGTTNPVYKLQINDGAIGFTSSSPSTPWSISTLPGHFTINQDATARLVIANWGGVGIGTTNPQYNLDVSGSIHSSYILDVDGDITTNNDILAYGSGYIAGTLAVNGNKGVAYNPTSATNLKVVPFTTATFTAILNGFQLSAEGSFAVPGGFTTTPRVYVGSINSTGGTAGELYRVQLMIYGCTTNSCKARLLNTSPNPVNYSITWDMLAVGN